MMQTAGFETIHPEFEVLNRVYARDILPGLVEREGERAVAQAKFMKMLWMAVAPLTGLGVLLFLSGIGAFFGILALAAAGGVAFWFYRPLGKIKSELHETLLPSLAAPLGMGFEARFEVPSSFKACRELKLLPGHDRSDFEDRLSGERHGQKFEIYEAHLERESKDSDGDTTWVTVFHGQIFRIDYPAKFLGTTIVRRDMGVLNRFGKPGNGFQNVGLGSREFEKAFEAWSTDQVEAHYLLDPVVLERFQELERLYDGKNLRAAWWQSSLYIALETGDRMNAGSIHKPLDDENRIRTILKEFATVYDLVDMTIKPVEGRLDGAISVEDVRAG